MVCLILVLWFILIFLMSMIIHHNSERVSSYLHYSVIVITILIGSYRATIREDTKVGSSLINVTATDNDIAPNNIICYYILSEVNISVTNYVM